MAIPFRFFILNLTADPEQKDQEQVFINPEIVKRHSSIEDEEGCLSFPGLYAKVRRAGRSRSRPSTSRASSSSIEADDLLSRAIQHETDHLDGKLFIDYLGPLARHSIEAKLREFEAELPPGPGRRGVSRRTTRSVQRARRPSGPFHPVDAAETAPG